MTTAKGAATRRRIVEAAAAEIRERGTLATTLDDVCRRSGTGKSQVFHSFFEIDHPETLKPPSIYDQSLVASYWGLFEDNDPNKRLMVIANVNGDISEYWEFSDTGLFVVDLSNEAYKFGVNYRFGL